MIHCTTNHKSITSNDLDIIYNAHFFRDLLDRRYKLAFHTFKKGERYLGVTGTIFPRASRQQNRVGRENLDVS